jgi:WYL domain
VPGAFKTKDLWPRLAAVFVSANFSANFSSIDLNLGSARLIRRGGETHLVEIEFDEYQARWIRERIKFHSTEEREELPDGRLVIRMEVAVLDGVKRFVMQYGAHAMVLKLEELRESIREEIKTMQAIYNGQQIVPACVRVNRR